MSKDQREAWLAWYDAEIARQCASAVEGERWSGFIIGMLRGQRAALAREGSKEEA